MLIVGTPQSIYENPSRFLLMGAFVLINLVLSVSTWADASQHGNATVDLRKVFDGFYKTKLSMKKIQENAKPFAKKSTEMKANLKTEMINYSNLLASASDPSVTRDERDRLKQAATCKLSKLDSARLIFQNLKKVQFSN